MYNILLSQHVKEPVLCLELPQQEGTDQNRTVCEGQCCVTL